MRIPGFVLIGCLAVSAAAVGMRSVVAAAPPPVAPCITATPACERWVPLNGGPARSMVYASFALDTPNPQIHRAVIMVHGTNRNADHYFETALAAAFLAGTIDDTLVIAPHMIQGRDTRAENEVLWQSSWRTGGPSVDNPNLSSFDFVDQILRMLAKKSVFPNLAHIVVTGHSAGGQFTTRYEMSNKVHDTLGVPVTYVVANPSSYAWPDATRPLPVGDAEPAAAKDGWNLQPNADPLPAHTNFTYGPVDAAKAPANYDRWPMGLEARTGYVAGISDDQLKKQLAERPTTYLLSQVDTLPLGGFDESPNAMLQGPTRRSRGEAFVKFVNEHLGGHAPLIIVPECGHNDRCVFTTDIVFPVVFPR